MTTTLRRAMTAVAAMATLAATMLAAAPAHAAPLSKAPEGTYAYYRHEGTTHQVGALGMLGSGDLVYCMETGQTFHLDYEREMPIDDGAEARRVAWLADHYRDSRDPLDHVAIAVLVHRHLDLNPGLWEQRWPSLVASVAGIEARVDQLWKLSGTSVPTGMTATYRYVEGARTGVVEVSVTDSSGRPLAGIPYSVTLHGEARFDAGGATVTGVSVAGTVTHPWTATGRGEVRVETSYDHAALKRLVSSQDYATFAGSKRTSGEGVTFRVRKDFEPSLSTEISRKVVDPGDTVTDVVTSGVRGDDDHWVPGLALRATGYYFAGLDAGVIGSAVEPRQGETTERFLARLGEAGHSPVAYGEATFTGPGQKAEVTAVTEPGGSEPYRADGKGGMATWVWAVERERQGERARDYLLADWTSSFAEAPETGSERSRVTVSSTVTEHSAAVGSELSDTITVSGFPTDHGDFPGDEAYGLGADRPHAQVSVWWAGDPDGQDGDDAYRPQGAEPPAEDAAHRLIGTWDYPAINGTIRVGGGAPDAHGDPVTIEAEDHGWYVFVWRFEGDDRVEPAASRYDDAWERTRVQEFAKEEPPTLTTQVDPESVKVDEPFRDTARVTGPVPEGSYVSFTAYEAVEEGVAPGGNGTLLADARVAVDHTRRDQTVDSPQTRSPKTGLVHWRATLFSADGDVLATHELGVDGETVRVEERERELPATGSAVPAVAIPAALAALALAALGVAVVTSRRRR